jgi:hypothetical protein
MHCGGIACVCTQNGEADAAIGATMTNQPTMLLHLTIIALLIIVMLHRIAFDGLTHDGSTTTLVTRCNKAASQ